MNQKANMIDNINQKFLPTLAHGPSLPLRPSIMRLDYARPPCTFCASVSRNDVLIPVETRSVCLVSKRKRTCYANIYAAIKHLENAVRMR